LAPRVDAELAEDRRDVVVDGLLGDDEPLRDLRVAKAFGQQRQNFELAVGQPGGVLDGTSAIAAS
jgi:hypothetical protein